MGPIHGRLLYDFQNAYLANSRMRRNKPRSGASL